MEESSTSAALRSSAISFDRRRCTPSLLLSSWWWTPVHSLDRRGNELCQSRCLAKVVAVFESSRRNNEQSIVGAMAYAKIGTSPPLRGQLTFRGLRYRNSAGISRIRASLGARRCETEAEAAGAKKSSQSRISQGLLSPRRHVQASLPKSYAHLSVGRLLVVHRLEASLATAAVLEISAQLRQSTNGRL